MLVRHIDLGDFYHPGQAYFLGESGLFQQVLLPNTAISSQHNPFSDRISKNGNMHTLSLVERNAEFADPF